MKFVQELQKHIDHNTPLFFDGGMGTMIHAAGITEGRSEELNFTRPEVILSIHAAYLAAGAQVLTTNTFGANPLKMEGCNFCAAETVAKAVDLAKNAIATSGKKAFVAFGIGQLGQLLEPMGSLTFEDACKAYATVCRAAEDAGADLILIETMSDLYELKAAILAAKENTKLPIIATATFQPNLRTLTGSDVQSIVTTLEALGVTALGFNCGGGLDEAAELATQFLAHASVPIIAQPNAGIPVVINGVTRFNVGAAEFAASQKKLFEQGVLILGGCCGTTPDHIKSMTNDIAECFNQEAIQQKVSRQRKINQQKTRISSYAQTIEIGSTEIGPVIVGERINPTGKKNFKEALLAQNWQYVLDEAQSQISAGSHILDVNVGLPGIDETATMCQAVRLLQRSFQTPLQIDSSEAAVLEQAMRIYNGKPLVNSVNGKQQVMHEVFPLIKKYGGTVVALLLDEDGIPPTAEGRLAIAKKILATAQTYGISPHDIVFDALTLTISSQQSEALETLKTLRLIKSELHLATILGVSNISFGLPRREIINAHFFTMALAAGLDACIINPLSDEMMKSYYAYKALSGFDANCLQYIEVFSNTVAQSQPEVLQKTSPAAPVHNDQVLTLKEIIIRGFQDSAAEATAELLKTQSPLQIIDNHIVTALDLVGKDFESGKKFLPQLLLSANTVAKAFEVIKAQLTASGQTQESKGTVLLATVYGDIHDIGKNIVKAMLENYGYTVRDLGKNVPVETIVSTVETEQILVVGLSALMTTTVANMEKTIVALRQLEQKTGKKITILVGGAVLTEDFAKKIGADYYSKDAMATVAIAKQIF